MSNQPEIDLIEQDLWDHYSGLPSPAFYQYIQQQTNEDNQDSGDRDRGDSSPSNS